MDASEFASVRPTAGSACAGHGYGYGDCCSVNGLNWGDGAGWGAGNGECCGWGYGFGDYGSGIGAGEGSDSCHDC